MTKTRNPLIIALVALPIVTLCFATLLFFSSPARQDSRDFALAIDNGQFAESDPAQAAAPETESGAMSATTGAPEISVVSIPLSEHELQAQVLAINASNLIIQGAVSAGIWTRTDSQALMNQLANVSPKQRQVLVEEFYTAINSRDLVLKDFPLL